KVVESDTAVDEAALVVPNSDRWKPSDVPMDEETRHDRRRNVGADGGNGCEDRPLRCVSRLHISIDVDLPIHRELEALRRDPEHQAKLELRRVDRRPAKIDVEDVRAMTEVHGGADVVGLIVEVDLLRNGVRRCAVPAAVSKVEAKVVAPAPVAVHAEAVRIAEPEIVFEIDAGSGRSRAGAYVESRVESLEETAEIQPKELVHALVSFESRIFIGERGRGGEENGYHGDQDANPGVPTHVGLPPLPRSRERGSVAASTPARSPRIAG